MSEKGTSPFGLRDDPALTKLIAEAKARYEAMSPVERATHDRAQRRSYVLAEIAMGSDADEVAYRRAVETDNWVEQARLEREGNRRAAFAAQHLEELGL
jgi:hypothetical protein